MGAEAHKRFEWIGTEKEILKKLAEGSELADTAQGTVEYTDAGEGPAILGVHGGVGGYDQGLVLCRPFMEKGFRVISPSRPGYLRTPSSSGRTFAEQADLSVGQGTLAQLVFFVVQPDEEAHGPRAVLERTHAVENVECHVVRPDRFHALGPSILDGLAALDREHEVFAQAFLHDLFLVLAPSLLGLFSHGEGLCQRGVSQPAGAGRLGRGGFGHRDSVLPGQGGNLKHHQKR